MSDKKRIPPLPQPDLTCWYGPSSEFYEEPMFDAQQMDARYLEGWRDAMEAAAKLCAGVLDMKEEARALQASRDASGAEDELRRLQHWATVSTFNAGVRRCVSAIRSIPAPDRES